MEKFLSYDAADLSLPKRHQLLLGAVCPRPIAWASTISADGVRNLAPFSWFNVFSNKPPILAFSPALRPADGSAKDTLRNVEEVPEVVINIANYSLVHQMVLTSAPFEAHIDEFEQSGLTPIPSDLIRPLRIQEAPIQFECRVRDILRFGKWGGAGNMIIAEVIRIHVRQDIFADESKGIIDPVRLDPIGRMGRIWYTRARDGLFELPNPAGSHILGWNGLPEWIRNSQVLTGNDLGQLAQVTELPTDNEIRNWKYWEDLRVLLLEYEHDNDMLQRKLHEHAQRYLRQGKVYEAWIVLRSYELIRQLSD